MKAEGERDRLSLENDSLLNILESEGYNKSVKYNPFLKRYEQCWCKDDCE